MPKHLTPEEREDYRLNFGPMPEREQFSDDLPVIRNEDGSINHFASNSLRSDPALSHPSDPEFIDLGGEQEIVQISGVPPGAEFKKKLADQEHKSAFGKSAKETIPTEFHMGDVEPNSPEDNWTEYVHSGKAWARSDKYPTPGHYQAAVVNAVIAMTSGFRRLWETR